MKQKHFAEKAASILGKDPDIIGLAAGGSWLTGMDEYSDLDLILVTSKNISADKQMMLEYAQRLGRLLSGFTGEHVGEPRVLICLYDDPLLHVDIKFLTLEEVGQRIETPEILLDRNELLKNTFENTKHLFPFPDHQWIEDRFWVWAHYALVKIGRGEYMEAFDFFAFLRMTVLGPLLHIKNGNLPRGVRYADMILSSADLVLLKGTIPEYNGPSLICALENAISLYHMLRKKLFDENILYRREAEEKVTLYLREIKTRVAGLDRKMPE